MKNKNLSSLIHEYPGQVKKTTDLLEHTFGTKNILRLWRSDKLPQRERITDNISYELHGIGCRVDFSGICIDFDYGPHERVDGFDPWRFYIYACEVPHRYKKYTNQNTLKLEFNNYIAQGKAERLTDSMSNLYFLKPWRPACPLTFRCQAGVSVRTVQAFIQLRPGQLHATTNNPAPNTRHNGE